MNSILRHGEFYGETRRRNCVPGLVLTESVHPARSYVPPHSHENAYFCYVLTGSYTETYDSKTRGVSISNIVFHPPAERHSERMHDTEARSFNVGIDGGYLKRIKEYSNVFDCQAFVQAGMSIMLAKRLYSEFRNMDDVSPLNIEALALELIVEVTRSTAKVSRRKPDIWLKRTQELLHSRFAETLSLNEIASEIGVHPVHLGREFRRSFRCTIGQYLRQLRVDYACRELNNKTKSLSMIALDAGFCDQSHLTRVFGKLMGMPPERYRSTVSVGSRSTSKPPRPKSFC